MYCFVHRVKVQVVNDGGYHTIKYWSCLRLLPRNLISGLTHNPTPTPTRTLTLTIATGSDTSEPCDTNSTLAPAAGEDTE